MIKIKYLENTVELMSAEFEKIMVLCPNYKYKTTSGYIVRGLDSTLVPSILEDTNCRAIDKKHTDAWCNAECHHSPPYCQNSIVFVFKTSNINTV